MIKTRKDLLFYLKEDAWRNQVEIGGFRSLLKYYIRILLGGENACVYRYIKCLRHCEYYTNTTNNFHHRIFRIMYKAKLLYLGRKYNISIQPNTCGYGLRIMHLSGGGGVLLNVKSIGNYCGFNSGVLLGNKGSQENRPSLGDHVAFGPGAKAFGNISIGNNVFVAPNAVVTKDFPDNCVIGGVPAKIIKNIINPDMDKSIN